MVKQTESKELGDLFVNRHVGPRDAEITEMLRFIDCTSCDQLIEKSVPKSIRADPRTFTDRPALTEAQATSKLRGYAERITRASCFIGQGYHGCIMPAVIRRNVLENPSWYTAYTPYQAEISQGRLEALINYQTMVSSLTGMEVANASLLDEATAAAEAMVMTMRVSRNDDIYFVDHNVHPQTIKVLQTRAEPLGIKLLIGDANEFCWDQKVAGCLVQYPATDGGLNDYQAVAKKCQENGALLTVASDLLALCLLEPPGRWGADIVVGSTQRFGVPLGFGGPHAAFFATKSDYARKIPGRLIGVSKDASGKIAYRMALQTREQHIRRDKATSNICTSQVLPAVLAGLYAVFHGREGLTEIANLVHSRAKGFANLAASAGVELRHKKYFDTVCLEFRGQAEAVVEKCKQENILIRYLDKDYVCVAFDETFNETQIELLGQVMFGKHSVSKEQKISADVIPECEMRKDSFLNDRAFLQYRSETDFQRYVSSLAEKDIALDRSMIPLGSCTMKLNSAAEMEPISWPEFALLHPLVPREHAQGYRDLIEDLEESLGELTGFDAVSLQPNAGSQGEFAGLLAIRGYHRSKGAENRNICLIPKSAHGTNPASAVMAGMKVVSVGCDDQGNIDITSLKDLAEKHTANLSCLMMTYPSTHGVFEDEVQEVTKIVHDHGGQVYLDGANMNAMVGICRPGDFGADVCHLNLHKTFCIPHGGGGPGVGPVAAKAHLAEFLPSQDLLVSAAEFGNAGVLPISWMYLQMMGRKGLLRATQVAILNANYIAQRLSKGYKILYRGTHGMVAHECIVDLRPFKKSANVEAEDIAKRLIDYGFHAPTMSWPVPGTIMIEPTESESLRELDRFCDAMLKIREEIADIEAGKQPRENNLLKNSPHKAELLIEDNWSFPYSKKQAFYPLGDMDSRKYWPPVARVDNAYGDRNLFCACPDPDAWQND